MFTLGARALVHGHQHKMGCVQKLRGTQDIVMLPVPEYNCLVPRRRSLFDRGARGVVGLLHASPPNHQASRSLLSRSQRGLGTRQRIQGLVLGLALDIQVLGGRVMISF